MPDSPNNRVGEIGPFARSLAGVIEPAVTGGTFAVMTAFLGEAAVPTVVIGFISEFLLERQEPTRNFGGRTQGHVGVMSNLTVDDEACAAGVIAKLQHEVVELRSFRHSRLVGCVVGLSTLLERYS